MFIKKKLKKQKKNNNFLKIINYVWFVIIFLLLIFIIWKKYNFNFYDSFSKIETNNLTKEQRLIVELEEEERVERIKKEKSEKLKKELDEKKENIMIIWRGGFWNDAPYLTDSIMILSYFKEKKQISILSVPRDLYVEYWDTNKYWKKIKWKINWLYVHYLSKNKWKKNQVKIAINKLEEKLEEITGEKIDNYIDIDFNWFVKLINSIDWITVNVKRNLYDTKYPAANHEFQTFSISKWIKKIYGQTALMYARSRHNSGWDFWRSERQQQIVKAVKNKVLSNDYLTSPSKIKDLYNIFDKYITTDIWFLKFTKLATNIKLEDNLLFYSSTINASCVKKDECDKGGFLFYPARKFFGWQSVLLSEGSWVDDLSNYEKIKKYTDIVFNYPNLFKENYKISIFSKLEDKKEALELKYDLKKYWLDINVLEKIWNIPKNTPNPLLEDKKNKISLEEYNRLKNITTKINTSDIYKESNNKKTKLIINWVNINSNTIKFLKNYLQIENKDIMEVENWPKYAKDKKTKIEIIYKN